MVVCGGVPGGTVLGYERTSAVWGGCGVDDSAGGAGGVVSAVGSVVVGLLQVSGFLVVMVFWLFLLW